MATFDVGIDTPTIARLRAHVTGGAIPVVIRTRGYSFAGDGGHAHFTWSPDSTTADNGGTVIRPDAVAADQPGRWISSAHGGMHPVRAFGAKVDGTDARAAILAAESGAASLAFEPGVYSVASSVTINSRVRFEAGAVLKPGSGAVITLAGPIDAPLSQVFDVSAGGQVQFAAGVTAYYRFEWWGARADATSAGGGTDSTAAITAAIAAIKQSFSNLGGGAVALSNKGFYRITSTIRFPRQQVIDLVGTSSIHSGFVFAGSAAAASNANDALSFELTTTQVTRVRWSDFAVYCPEGANGIHLNNITNGNGWRWCRFNNLLVVGLESAPFTGTRGFSIGTLTTSRLDGVIVRGFDYNWYSYMASGANASGGNLMVQCVGASGLTANFYLPDFISTKFDRCRSESRDLGHALGMVQYGWYIANAVANSYSACSCEDAYSEADWYVSTAARSHWTDCAAGTHTPKNAAAVISHNGVTFTDETTDAASAGTGDVVLRATPAAADGALYVGSTYKFRALQVVTSTAATDGAVAWEYWNGSAWTTLGATDNTNAFRNSGTKSVVWADPSGWATTSVNGSAALYFVRARLTSGTTQALGTTVKLASSGVAVLLDNVDASEWTRGHISAHPSGTTFQVNSNCNGFVIAGVGLEDGYASVVDNGTRTRINVYAMPSANFGTYTIYPARGERSGMPRITVTATGTVDPLRYGLIVVDSSSPVNLTLSSPGGLPGEGLPVRVFNKGSAAVTVLRGGTDLIDSPGSVGGTSITLSGQGHSLHGTYTDNGNGTNTLLANKSTT